MEKERVNVPDEIKREVLSGQINDCLNGDNLLAKKLGKELPVKMNGSMRELWLERLMKEPTGLYVERCMKTQFTQPIVASLWPMEMQIKEDPHPELELFFYHFAFPYEGNEAWEAFKKLHEKLLFQGQANNEHIKNSYLQKMPLDVSYFLYTFKEKKKNQKTPVKRSEIMRFIVHEPLAEDAKGAILQVSPTDARTLGIV
jgi:hypothetical protein